MNYSSGEKCYSVNTAAEWSRIRRNKTVWIGRRSRKLQIWFNYLCGRPSLNLLETKLAGDDRTLIHLKSFFIKASENKHEIAFYIKTFGSSTSEKLLASPFELEPLWDVLPSGMKPVTDIISPHEASHLQEAFARHKMKQITKSLKTCFWLHLLWCFVLWFQPLEKINKENHLTLTRCFKRLLLWWRHDYLAFWNEFMSSISTRDKAPAIISERFAKSNKGKVFIKNEILLFKMPFFECFFVFVLSLRHNLFTTSIRIIKKY